MWDYSFQANNPTKQIKVQLYENFAEWKPGVWIEVRQSFGRVQCLCFPRTRAVEPCSGPTFNQWLWGNLVLFLHASWTSEGCSCCLLWVLNPAMQLGLGCKGVHWNKPASGSVGQEHVGLSMGLTNRSMAEQHESLLWENWWQKL